MSNLIRKSGFPSLPQRTKDPERGRFRTFAIYWGGLGHSQEFLFIGNYLYFYHKDGKLASLKLSFRDFQYLPLYIQEFEAVSKLNQSGRQTSPFASL